MGRWHKILIHFSWVACFFLLMACAGGTPTSADLAGSGAPANPGPVGGGVGEGSSNSQVLQNQGAPYQVSGSGSEDYDPVEGDLTVIYRIKLATDPENLAPTEEGGFLFKGSVRKQWPSSPDLSGRVLRVLDNRYHAFIDIPLGNENAGVVSFEAQLKFEPVSEEALYDFGHEAFSFRVSPDGFNSNQAVTEIQPCPGGQCLGQDWHKTILLKPYTPPPSVPPAQDPNGKTPPKPIRLPGKK